SIFIDSNYLENILYDILINILSYNEHPWDQISRTWERFCEFFTSYHRKYWKVIDFIISFLHSVERVLFNIGLKLNMKKPKECVNIFIRSIFRTSIKNNVYETIVI